MRAGQAQATVRALHGDGLATQAVPRSWWTRGRAVCQLTGPCSINIGPPSNIQGGSKVAAIIELHPVLAAGDVLYCAHTTLVGTVPFVDHYPVANFEFLLGHF